MKADSVSQDCGSRLCVSNKFELKQVSDYQITFKSPTAKLANIS